MSPTTARWMRSEGGTLFRLMGGSQHVVRQGRDGLYRWELRNGDSEVSLASWTTEAEAVADLLATLAERQAAKTRTTHQDMQI